MLGAHQARLEEPLLAGVERREGAPQRLGGRLGQRRDAARELPRAAGIEAGRSVAELAAEDGIVVHLGLADGEAGRGALLSLVTKGRADEVAYGLVAVGQRGDDHRVLAARLGEEPEIRAPGEEAARRLGRAGEDDRVHTRVRDERASHVVVGTRHELEHLARNASIPQRARQMPAHQHRLGSGLEERAVAGGEGGEHAAGGNGEREIPGRGDDDDSQWVHLAANEIGRHLFERARIVAGEVDGLRDLRVGLGHRLGAVDDHGADEVGATAGEDARGLLEEGAALRG